MSENMEEWKKYIAHIHTFGKEQWPKQFCDVPMDTTAWQPFQYKMNFTFF